MKKIMRFVFFQKQSYFFRYLCYLLFCIINIVLNFEFLDLLHCTNEPNVSIPTLANLLIERTQNPNWVVVFKSLITTHHLMCYGNEVRHLLLNGTY